MILVVDFNVVFSSVITIGKSRFVFELNDIFGKSLKFNCKILSGDKGLKKALPDRVITPSEALEILLGMRVM